MIDPLVLTDPAWLEEHLTLAGVADDDWSRRVPDEVIAVVCAMHDRGRKYAEIAAHLAAAAVVHVEVQRRTADLDRVPAVILPLAGGRWVPNVGSIENAHQAPERRARKAAERAEARAHAAAAGVAVQLELFDIPRARRNPEKPPTRRPTRTRRGAQLALLDPGAAA